MGETVYDRRGYKVRSGASAKKIVAKWLADEGIVLQSAKLKKNGVTLGLAEVDDRYHIWRVGVLRGTDRLGEVVVVALTGQIDVPRSSSVTAIKAGLAHVGAAGGEKGLAGPATYEKGATLRRVVHGDSHSALDELAAGSVDLVFTSPPYYNARPEYADYSSYEEYLAGVAEVIGSCARVLGEGRFFVMNVSAVLVRRENRNVASRRIAVPFDMHPLFLAAGFDFIDHIVWEKPAGAGWATSRGRRFSADRNPLAYKTVPVTEDLLVYRKHSSRLLDWNIHNYPDQEAVAASRIDDGYEATNIWRLSPSNDKRHPAIFPDGLCERVIRYYSFIGDTVLDPYAGLGTTGRVASRLGRGFVQIERDEKYFGAMVADLEKGKWGVASGEVDIIDE